MNDLVSRARRLGFVLPGSVARPIRRALAARELGGPSNPESTLPAASLAEARDAARTLLTEAGARGGLRGRNDPLRLGEVAEALEGASDPAEILGALELLPADLWVGEGREIAAQGIGRLDMDRGLPRLAPVWLPAHLASVIGLEEAETSWLATRPGLGAVVREAGVPVRWVDVRLDSPVADRIAGPQGATLILVGSYGAGEQLYWSADDDALWVALSPESSAEAWVEAVLGSTRWVRLGSRLHSVLDAVSASAAAASRVASRLARMATLPADPSRLFLGASSVVTAPGGQPAATSTGSVVGGWLVEWFRALSGPVDPDLRQVAEAAASGAFSAAELEAGLSSLLDSERTLQEVVAPKRQPWGDARRSGLVTGPVDPAAIARARAALLAKDRGGVDAGSVAQSSPERSTADVTRSDGAASSASPGRGAQAEGATGRVTPAPASLRPDEVAARAEAAGNVDEALAAWLRAAETATDRLETFGAWVHRADRRAARQPGPGVAEALGRAHVLAPENKAVVVKLVEASRSYGTPSETARWLEALVALETQPDRRARALFTLATLYSDTLMRPVDARVCALRAFEGHPDDDSFALLERLSEPADLDRRVEAALAGTLPEALRTRLLRRRFERSSGTPDALLALRAALEASPRDPELLEAAARHEESAGHDEAAWALYHRVLSDAPRRVSAYRGLGRIVARRRDRDAAWCVATALVELDAADVAERDFVEKHRKGLLAVRRTFAGDADWERVLEPQSLDRATSALLELAGSVLGAVGFPAPLVGVGERLPVDARLHELAATISRIWGVAAPVIYRTAQVGTHPVPLVAKLASSPPILLVNPQLDVLKGKEQRFLLGKALTFFRRRFALAGLASGGIAGTTAHVRRVLFGALSAGTEEPATIAEMGVLEVRDALLARLSGDGEDALRRCVADVEASGGDLSAGQWLQEAERTANRAGLLLSNDLGVAVRMVAREHELGVRWSKLSCDEAVADLIRYAASEPYFDARRSLGASVDG